MQLNSIIRAPFIAPGRRNRKVVWDRSLSRIVASLGRFEREDWRGGLFLPRPFREWPQFNNQFSPGGGSGCGCCGETLICGPCSQSPDEFEAVVGTITNGTCTDCVTAFSGQTYILPLGFASAGECIWSISVGTSGVCATFPISTIIGVRSLGSAFGFGIANSLSGLDMRWNDTFSPGTDCTAFSSQPLPHLSSTSRCDGSADPCLITAL